MTIEERIELPADSGDLDAAADAAEALAKALGDVEENAIKASKATENAAKSAKGALGEKLAKAPAALGAKKQAAEDAKLPGKGAKKAPNEAKAAKQQAAEEKKAASEKAKVEKKADAARKAAEKNKKILRDNEAKAQKAAKDAFLGIGKAAIGGAALAVGALAAIGAGLHKLGDVKIARDNIRAMLNQLTRGRGDEAFAKLDKLAKSLGKSTEDVAQDFYNLRKQGLSNINSGKLIKLKADLEAVGVQAPDVESALNKVTEAIKRGGNADAAIAQVAKHYGAIGTGANAAAKSAFTVEGAFNRLQRTLDNALGALADAFGPTIVDLIDTFEDSLNKIDPNDLKEGIANVKAGLEELKPAIQDAVALVGQLLKAYNALSKQGVGLKTLLFPASALLRKPAPLPKAGRDSALADKAEADARKARSAAFAKAHAAEEADKAALADKLAKAADKNKATKSASPKDQIIAPVKDSLAESKQLGADFADGLAQGIKDGTPKIADAAKDAAQAAIDATKGTDGFDSHSPSKKMLKEGRNAVAGITQPFAEMRDVKDLLPRTFFDGLDKTFRPSNDNGGAVTTTSAGGSASGAPSVVVHLSITIESGAKVGPETVDEIEERVESAVRRAVS